MGVLAGVAGLAVGFAGQGWSSISASAGSVSWLFGRLGGGRLGCLVFGSSSLDR